MSDVNKQDIIVERRGGALVICLNKPEVGNELSLDLANNLHTVIKNATTDRSVRAVLLRGQNGVFMQGYDMKPFAGNFTRGLELANQRIQPWNNIIRELQVMEKPVVAALEGRVIGAGFALAMASDLIVASDDVTLQAGYATHARTPDGGLSWTLPRRVGITRACEILMCDPVISSHDGATMGLINYVYDRAQFHEQVLALVDNLANGPTRAFGGIKSLLRESFKQGYNEQLGLEHLWFGNTGRSFDFREMLLATHANSTPKYSGA